MIWIVVVVLFCAVTVAVVVFTMKAYHIFCKVRLAALSIASKADAVGGVGISLLCPMPQSVATVVGLLDSHYPMSEIVVVLDGSKHINLFKQLRIRYRLEEVASEGQRVYRSSRCCYRRLVVVVVEQEFDRGVMLDMAARNSIYDYLLTVSAQSRLCRTTVGRIADTIAAHSREQVDVITTSESGMVALSRRQWRRCGGFTALKEPLQCENVVHIDYPLLCYSTTERGQTVIIERSEYNFWAFLSLNIMKYRNKLLSLKKP